MSTKKNNNRFANEDYVKAIAGICSIEWDLWTWTRDGSDLEYGAKVFVAKMFDIDFETVFDDVEVVKARN